jgi:DNA-binding CsgD family transcriptional regulator
MSPVMVGRAVALHRLLGLVESAEIAAFDGPEIALVSGEPGVGKTRLLREMIERLPADVTVLSAQAQPGSLGRAFDVIGQLAPIGTPPAQGARQTIEDAVAKGRTVLVVEDLHWADADSAHLLEQLVLQPWPQLILVGTYRANDLSPKAPGGELVLRLERQHSVEQIRLERLDLVDVAAMLGAIGGVPPSSAAVEAVYRRSGGIPFVVEELLRGTGRELCSDDLLTAQLPWSLDEAVRQQLAGLSVAERGLVDALAVFGDPASFDMLATLTELPEHDLLEALRELARANVLIEPTNDYFWFAHALVADAVSHQLLGRERRRLHQRALVALEAQPEPDDAALARHAAGAGHFEQIVAIARRGSRGYLDRGASFQALRLAGNALTEAPNDVDLLRVATDAAWRLDFLTEALTYGRRWREVADTDLDRVEAQRFIARLLHEQAPDVERDAALDELIQLAESLPPGRARGRSYGAVAQIMMLSERGDKAVAWADRALEAARAEGDEWLVAQAMVEHASAWVQRRTQASAAAELRAAYQASRAVGDTVLACRALNNLLSLVVAHSEQADAIRADLRVLTASAGFDKLGAPILAFRDADAAFGRGESRAFRNAIAEAAQYSGEWSGERHQLLSYQAVLALEEGRPKAALELLGEIALLSGSCRSDFIREVPASRLFAAAQLADATLAAEAWRGLLAAPAPPNAPYSLPAMVQIVDAAIVAGIEPRRIRVEMFEEWLSGHSCTEEYLECSEGLLLLAEGHPQTAVGVLQAILAAPAMELTRPVLASLRLTLGASLLAIGDRAGALVAVRRVVDEDLVNWPGWRRDRAEALLRRLEGSSSRSEGELTTREREVAALIAEGLTNGQLAERLYISPKTAAVHVSNILTKLGLSGRAEVAAWAVRRGIVLQAS